MASKRPLAFVKAIEFTLKWEVGSHKDGGYTNNPLDPGGETKWGISKRANPDLDIPNLTLEQAMDRYKQKYWDIYVSLKPISANLDNLPTALAVAVFDAGVNCGVGNAIKWLGKALDTKNPSKTVNDLRGAYYFDLVSFNRTKYNPFIKGWTNRLNDLKKYCEILETEAQALFATLTKTKKVGYGKLS
jgi:lysozyme family protein